MRNWGVINNWLVPYWSGGYLPAPLPPPLRETSLTVRNEWEHTPAASLMDQQQAFQRGGKEKEMKWHGKSGRGEGGGGGKKMR